MTNFKLHFFLQLRDLVSEKFEAVAEQVCLIFAGKILKDGK